MEPDAQDTSRARAAAAWTRFWARGALHSCPCAFAADYGAEIRGVWSDFFAAQPSGARLLDVGTGNGAIAFIARDTSAQRACAFEIEAIDQAQIFPERAAAAGGLNAQGVTFRAGVSADASGFPDAWFDAVSSQFALEYMPLEATLAELARITKPGADLMFVMHHADSPAMAITRHELDSFEYLQHEVPLLVNARRFLQRLRSAHDAEELKRLAGDSETESQARELNRMVGQVIAHARSRPDAEFVGAIAAQIVTALREIRSVGLNAGLERLHVLGEEMQAHRVRLRAIAAAAHTRPQIEALAARMQHAGFVTQPHGELRVGSGVLLGWILRVRRAS